MDAVERADRQLVIDLLRLVPELRAGVTPTQIDEMERELGRLDARIAGSQRTTIYIAMLKWIAALLFVLLAWIAQKIDRARRGRHAKPTDC